MLDRRSDSLEEALAGIGDGARLMISGFGEAGRPNMLLAGLLDKGVRDLELISNNAGEGETGLAALLLAGRVRKLICSFPRGAMSDQMIRLVEAGGIEVEVMPQGTLAERLRAGGAGIPAFYTPTSVGTAISAGKETRVFDKRTYVLEHGLSAPLALIKARRADRWGNLTYDKLARNFAPMMCAASTRTIVEADEIVELGDISPESVVTPGIFVDCVIQSRPVPSDAWKVAA